jgi:hypothetical protein
MSDPAARPYALLLEQFGPLLAAVATVTAIGLNRDAVTAKFTSEAWTTSNLYSAVFAWSGIQTGFAFAVYGFVVGKSEGFVEALRDTFAMRRFLRYVTTANIGGFVLSIVSIPLTIANPSPAGSTFWTVTLWFGLFIWTFFAFLRIAFNFGRLSNVRDRKPFYGA